MSDLTNAISATVRIVATDEADATERAYALERAFRGWEPNVRRYESADISKMYYFISTDRLSFAVWWNK